ncbi:MAG: hypothetical protein AAB422_06430, partial [Planctomycetota bacterium]
QTSFHKLCRYLHGNKTWTLSALFTAGGKEDGLGFSIASATLSFFASKFLDASMLPLMASA